MADGDRAGTWARLSVWPAVVREGAGATTVTVRAELDGTALSTPRVLTVSVGGGTAGSGDYDAVADFALTIAAQQTRGAGTFTLTPTADTVAEGIETLSVVARGELPAAGAVLALADDDGTLSAVRLSVWPAVVREGAGATTVTVRADVDGALVAQPRVVRVALSPVAPVGYALGAARVLTIDAGETASGNTVTLGSTADVYDTPDGLATLAGAAQRRPRRDGAGAAAGDARRRRHGVDAGGAVGVAAVGGGGRRRRDADGDGDPGRCGAAAGDDGVGDGGRRDGAGAGGLRGAGGHRR